MVVNKQAGCEGREGCGLEWIVCVSNEWIVCVSNE